MKTNAVRTIRSTAPLPAIRIGTIEKKEGFANATTLLIIFMRVVALLWIGEGIVQWAVLLMDPNGDALANASAQRLAAIGFFCVLDFVAGIGLWLAAPWGGVVWLVTLGGQLIAIVVLPGFWTFPVLTVLVDSVLAIAYLVLAWLAARESEQQR